MKKIKFLLLGIALVSTVMFISCDECDGENPRARIINNGTGVVAVQIKTSGGNTENINNVDVGKTSDYRSYAKGDVTFTVSIAKQDYVKTLSMSECYEYDITINANNELVSTSRDRNE